MSFPVFASGDVLNASDMNAVGLWLVKTQTVGSGVSSVTVTGAFSADYDNYLVTYTGGTESALALIYVYLGSTRTGYYGTRLSATIGGAANSTGDNNSAQFTYASAGDPGSANMKMTFLNPFQTKITSFESLYFEPNGASSTFGTYVGLLNNSTSYSSFTIEAQSPRTLTGGTIRVYGYRN